MAEMPKTNIKLLLHTLDKVNKVNKYFHYWKRVYTRATSMVTFQCNSPSVVTDTNSLVSGFWFKTTINLLMVIKRCFLVDGVYKLRF